MGRETENWVSRFVMILMRCTLNRFERIVNGPSCALNAAISESDRRRLPGKSTERRALTFRCTVMDLVSTPVDIGEHSMTRVRTLRVVEERHREEDVY